jgi:hypothetical protein
LNVRKVASNSSVGVPGIGQISIQKTAGQATPASPALFAFAEVFRNGQTANQKCCEGARSYLGPLMGGFSKRP